MGDEQPVDASQPAAVVDETPQCTVDRDALAGNLCVGNAMVVVGFLRDEVVGPQDVEGPVNTVLLAMNWFKYQL